MKVISLQVINTYMYMYMYLSHAHLSIYNHIINGNWVDINNESDFITGNKHIYVHVHVLESCPSVYL